MSIFEDLAKNVLGSSFGESSSSGTNWIQLGLSLLDKVGGLEGLRARFQDGGLGNLVTSWIGNDQNLPVNAEQIKQALHGVLPQAAQEAGTDTDTAAQGLASILPDLVNKLTPQGEASASEGGFESLLRGGISKFFS